MEFKPKATEKNCTTLNFPLSHTMLNLDYREKNKENDIFLAPEFVP